MPSRAPDAASLLRIALLLGLVQGPTEVLPVSSSAHIALLEGAWSAPDAPRTPELRNSLEVALHAGAAAALLIVLRGELVRGVRALDRKSAAAMALALGPPALVGYLLEQRLERRAPSPRTVATGLALGGAAMAWADARPSRRRLAALEPRDGLALGIAQALALLPGVSRNGATLTAARARGFAREDAHALSWRAGLPVLAGATALKAYRLGRSRATRVCDASPRFGQPPPLGQPLPLGQRLPFGQRPPFGQHPGFRQDGAPAVIAPTLAVGAGAAFLSTLACAPLLRPGRRGRALWPFALYRTAVALAAVASSGPASDSA